MSRDCSLRNEYSQELPRLNRKRLEKYSIEKSWPYPKPVAVETVDPNRTRPKSGYGLRHLILDLLKLVRKGKIWLLGCSTGNKWKRSQNLKSKWDEKWTVLCEYESYWRGWLKQGVL